MRFLATLRDRYGFTRTELSVIAVLGLTYAAGSVLRWASGTRDPADVPAFDYRSIDSVFLSRSVLKPAADSVRRGSLDRTTLPVDLNAAGMAELETLPGIGPKLAERILSYRRDHGNFRAVGDLVNVKGIGPKKLERLRPFVTAR